MMFLGFCRSYYGTHCDFLRVLRTLGLTSPQTSEVLKTSPVTINLIYFWQYFEALFLVKTCFLTSHREKYSTPDRFIREATLFQVKLTKHCKIRTYYPYIRIPCALFFRYI